MQEQTRQVLRNLPGPKPARSMVQFGAVTPGLVIAIDAIALA